MNATRNSHADKWSICEGKSDELNLHSICYLQVCRVQFDGIQLLVPPTQALGFVSARSSSYPISALPRPATRLPRVDAIGDMRIDDAVEEVAPAMVILEETVMKFTIALATTGPPGGAISE